MKTIKIGENEYTPGFSYDVYHPEGYDIRDKTGLKLEPHEIVLALNELAVLREEVGIYKDDSAMLHERIKAALDNARCPECGCGDVNEAESNECGCEAPVCNIQCPETLAGAYVRVYNELAALRETVGKFHAVFDKWWEHYSTNQPNANKQEGWGWVDDAWCELKKVAEIEKARE